MALLTRIVLIFLILSLPIASEATVCAYIDANGNRHYMDHHDRKSERTVETVVAAELGEQQSEFPQGDEILLDQDGAEFLLLTLLAGKQRMPLSFVEQPQGDGCLAKWSPGRFRREDAGDVA